MTFLVAPSEPSSTLPSQEDQESRSRTSKPAPWWTGRERPLRSSILKNATSPCRDVIVPSRPSAPLPPPPASPPPPPPPKDSRWQKNTPTIPYDQLNPFEQELMRETILRRAVDATVGLSHHDIRIDFLRRRVTVTDYGNGSVLSAFLKELRRLKKVHKSMTKARDELQKEIHRLEAYGTLDGQRNEAKLGKLKVVLQGLPIPVPLLASIKELHFKSGAERRPDSDGIDIVNLHVSRLCRILKKCPGLETLHLEHVRVVRRDGEASSAHTFPSLRSLRLTYDDSTLVPDLPGFFCMFPRLRDCQVDGGYCPRLEHYERGLEYNVPFGAPPSIRGFARIPAPTPSLIPPFRGPPLERLCFKTHKIGSYITEDLLVSGALANLKELHIALLDEASILLVARVVNACRSSLEHITLDLRYRKFQHMMSEISLLDALRLERFEDLIEALASCRMLQSFSYSVVVRADHKLNARVPHYMLLFLSGITMEGCPRLTQLNLDLHLEGPPEILKEPAWRSLQFMVLKQDSLTSSRMYEHLEENGHIPVPVDQLNQGPFRKIRVNLDTGKLSKEGRRKLQFRTEEYLNMWYAAGVLEVGVISPLDTKLRIQEFPAGYR